MKTNYEVEDNGRMFIVSCDIDDMRRDMQDLYDNLEGTTWRPNGDDDPPATVEEVQADAQAGLNFLTQLETSPRELLLPIIRAFPRKKDGWLPKNRVALPLTMSNIGHISVEEYGYRYYAIRAQAVNAMELSLSFDMEIDKW